MKNGRSGGGSEKAFGECDSSPLKAGKVTEFPHEDLGEGQMAMIPVFCSSGFSTLAFHHFIIQTPFVLSHFVYNEL